MQAYLYITQKRKPIYSFLSHNSVLFATAIQQPVPLYVLVRLTHRQTAAIIIYTSTETIQYSEFVVET